MEEINTNVQRSHPVSPGQTQSAVQAALKPSSFHCSVERHLHKLKSPVAAFIYLFAARLSNGSGRFNASTASLVEYFGVAKSTVIRALALLISEGLLVEIERRRGRPVVYRVVPHDEWAQAHPGRCVTKSVRSGGVDATGGGVGATTGGGVHATRSLKLNLEVEPKPENKSKPEARRETVEPATRPNSSHSEDHDHDCECINGWLYVTDAKGATRVRQCERWVRWKKRLIAERDAATRPPAAQPQYEFRDPDPPRPDSFAAFSAYLDAPTPGWSKATSGPRRLIRNVTLPDGRYALWALHAIVRDCFGMYDDEEDESDFSGRTWKRINGMLQRMPHGTVDEFRGAMREAADELERQREIHAGGSFYFDYEKSALWAVGRATRCSHWID